jgi:potassium-dependent mechanosensitive channel
MHRLLIALLSTVLLAMIASHFAVQAITSQPKFDGAVKVAFAGPLSGTGQTGGREMLAAAEAQADDVNAHGGINGLKLQIVPFDDRNSPDGARAAAEEIVRQGDILAVIGHNYSSASLAAAPIYAAAGIPAISPASTNPNVTRGKPWYFRTIFSDITQGAFLARYAHNALNAQNIIVIASTDPYAGEVSASFHQAASDIGLIVSHDAALDPKAPDFAANVAAVTDKLKSASPDAIIFLAMHIDPAVAVVRSIRDAGLKQRILGPDSLGSTRFAQAFAALPNEQSKPGHYTDRLFVSVPFLTDTGNQEARRLIDRLEQKLGSLTTWGAPFAYDAAKLIAVAARRSELRSGTVVSANTREAVRDQLTAMRSASSALVGATGSLRFDADNTPLKSLIIGQFRDRLISSLVQMSFDAETGALSRTPVVYVGAAVDAIDRIDPRAGSAWLTLDLWFRYQGDLPVADIVFPNALAQPNLDRPEESVSSDGIEYRRYRISAPFKMNFDYKRPAPGDHIVGMQFHHRTLSRDQLIYVADRAGGQTDDPIRSQVVHGDWRVINSDASADIIDLKTKGNPLKMKGGGDTVQVSNYMLRAEIAPRDLGVRRQLTGQTALAAAIGATLLLIGALAFDARGGQTAAYRGAKLALSAVAVILFLIASESLLFDALANAGADAYFDPTTTAFDTLWWIIGAVLAAAAINRFVWEPLERSTERLVPGVVRNFVAFFVYVLATLGIFTGVMQKDVTNLLATSGMLAMIIGLAVQSNLSNIFSGIALNIERPFRPGDWVKIGEAQMGKVIDMSWRSTKIETFSNSVISIPNSLAAGSRIENCSFPNRRYFIFQTLHFDPKHDPARISQLLADGLRLAESVDGRPRLDLTWVKFNGVDELGLKFLVAFDVYDRSLMNSQEHMALTSIERTLRSAGVRMATRHTTMHVREDDPESAAAPPLVEALLSAAPQLADYDDETRERLARAAVRRIAAPGDVLLRAGDPADKLLLVADGVASIYAEFDGDQELDRVGGGAILGVGALHGDRRVNGTAKAVGPMTYYEIRLTELEVA